MMKISDDAFAVIVLICLGVLCAVWGCGGSARLAFGVSAATGTGLLILERLFACWMSL